MRIASGRTPGRRHVQEGLPCQDAFAVLDQPDLRRAAAAVADGLGSQPLSGTGSQAAADAAMAALAGEPFWDEAAITRAFEAARLALDGQAALLEVPPSALATTLQVATLEGGLVRAAMVGDGAVVACREQAPESADARLAPLARSAPPALPAPAATPRTAVLLAPPPAAYANEVVPLTAPSWREHLRHAAAPGDVALLFSDGLTRLLLAKGKGAGDWEPFAPFFGAFVPHVRDSAFDPQLVQRFLERPDVERSWDDDKCLVVLADAP